MIHIVIHVCAERVALRAQIYKAQEDAGALMLHTEASLKSARTDLIDMKGKAKKFRVVAKKIKEQSKLKIGQLAKQLKGQDAAVGKLRELLAQADDRYDAAQAESAHKLHAAQRRAEELQLLLSEQGDGRGGSNAGGGSGESLDASGREGPPSRRGGGGEGCMWMYPAPHGRGLDRRVGMGRGE